MRCGACVDFKKKFLNLLKGFPLPSSYFFFLLISILYYTFLFSLLLSFVVVVVLEISSSSTCTSYSTTTGLPLFKIIIPSLYPFYSPHFCLLIQHSSRYLSLFFHWMDQQQLLLLLLLPTTYPLNYQHHL